MMSKYWLVNSLLAVATVVVLVSAEGRAQEQKLANVSIDQAMQAPATALVTAYLVIDYNLLALRLAELGATVQTAVDGATQTITKDNVEQYRVGFQARLQTYTDAITRRGSPRLAGDYKMKVTSKCKRLGLANGKATLGQEDFRIKLSKGNTDFTGVAVESALALSHPVSPDVYLVGELDQDRIRLQHEPSNCKVTLVKR